MFTVDPTAFAIKRTLISSLYLEESKISISSNLEIQNKFERILIDEHQNIGIMVEIANFHSKLFGFYREMDEFNDTKCSAPMAQKEMASHTIRMK